MSRETASINFKRYPAWIAEYRLWSAQARLSDDLRIAKMWGEKADMFAANWVGMASI